MEDSKAANFLFRIEMILSFLGLGFSFGDFYIASALSFGVAALLLVLGVLVFKFKKNDIHRPGSLHDIYDDVNATVPLETGPSTQQRNESPQLIKGVFQRVPQRETGLKSSDRISKK